MQCTHSDYVYQKRCSDCGKFIKGNLSGVDMLFFILIGFSLGVLVTGVINFL
jgi:hypothetical protein